MCRIEHFSIPDDGQRYAIESPTKEDIQRLMTALGENVEGFHIHCMEGTLTVGSAGLQRAWVFYSRAPYQNLTVPQGWSNGRLLDEQYADSDETVDIICGGMPDSMLLYHTVTKEIAQRTAEYFLEKQAFLDGHVWLRR